MKIGNLEVYGIIYKITNKVNDKVYIGQTTMVFHQRYKGGNWQRYTHNQYLKNSVNKYGIENFETNKCFDIAYSKEELDEKEIYWIGYYNSNIRLYGYNSKDGGSNGRPNMETRKRMSDNHWSKNINISEKLRENLSKVHKGKIGLRGKLNYGYGKHLSEETKLKMSKSTTGRKMSNEQKNKISIGNTGRKHTIESNLQLSKTRIKKGIGIGSENNSAITVCMYDLTMHLIKVFATRLECAEWLLKNGYIKILVTWKICY